MKKVLINVILSDYMSLELGIAKYHEGYDVYFVGCDKSVRFCEFGNQRGDSCLCRLCSHTMKSEIDKLVKSDTDRFHYVSTSSIMTDEMREHARRSEFSYNSTKELKSIVYKDVEIGFAAFSAYVSLTRNVMPTYNEKLKDYIDTILRYEVSLTDALDAYINIIKPDLIIFHNGRLPNVKPPYGLAKAKGIEYISTERIFTRKSSWSKAIMDNYVNGVPHSPSAIREKIEEKWNQLGEEKYEIGKLFFENHYHSKYAGDKAIYSKDQKLGLLPEDFNPSLRNIVIFNSSEHEYFSVSKERDAETLFPNQYIALKTIFEHYKNDSTIHFYLRIHPQLAQVPYKSHTMLYDLKYENVTIIPPSSPISSYTLMENAEKIIVFNSTMGLESAYWGKPVIILNTCFYLQYNVAYKPHTPDELYNLIDNRELERRACPVENYYKPALRLMGYIGEPVKYYNCRVIWKKLPIRKRPFAIYSSFKLLGSCYLYQITYHLLKYLAKAGVLSKYSEKYMANTI